MTFMAETCFQCGCINRYADKKTGEVEVPFDPCSLSPTAILLISPEYNEQMTAIAWRGQVDGDRRGWLRSKNVYLLFDALANIALGNAIQLGRKYMSVVDHPKGRVHKLQTLKEGTVWYAWLQNDAGWLIEHPNLFICLHRVAARMTELIVEEDESEGYEPSGAWNPGAIDRVLRQMAEGERQSA